MDRAELARRLEEEGFRPDAYDLTDNAGSETYVLQPVEDKWVVFYSERGFERGKQSFHKEGEACEFFLNWLRSDPTTKQP